MLQGVVSLTSRDMTIGRDCANGPIARLHSLACALCLTITLDGVVSKRRNGKRHPNEQEKTYRTLESDWLWFVGSLQAKRIGDIGRTGQAS